MKFELPDYGVPNSVVTQDFKVMEIEGVVTHLKNKYGENSVTEVYNKYFNDETFIHREGANTRKDLIWKMIERDLYNMYESDISK